MLVLNSTALKKVRLHSLHSIQELLIDLERCNLPSEPGLCKAYFPSYYYDTATQSCKQFIYGGCGGNSNRFASQDECINTCSEYE